MRDLFDPCSIGSLSLKNRFVRSATGESRATPEGVLLDSVFPIYEALADGGVGLIISGHMYVDQDWKCSPGQTGAASNDHLPGLRRLAQASQGNGAKTVAQINHAGRPPTEMSEADIQAAADRFVEAGARAMEAGFDGVQLHAAHGYLISGFLTPSENQRQDAYGGDADGRRRLALEIATRLRQTLGPDYPILCKLGAVDGRDDSLALEESVATAQALAGIGIDALEISATCSGDLASAAATGINKPEKEAYFATQAKAIKAAVDIPVILVGGLRSRQVMQRVLDEGVCDLVSLCRPFIREPDLVNAIAAGRTERVACVSCNKCYDPSGFRCVHRKDEG